MRSQTRPRSGFTLVEIMIGASITSLLVLLAMPAFKNAKRKTERAQLVQELRTTGDSFQIYAADHGGNMPATTPYGTFPEGMEGYLPKHSTWTQTPPGGGYWAWLTFEGSSALGFRGFVAVLDSDFTSEDFQDIDDDIDNGILANGGVIYAKPWMLYGVN